MAVHYKTMHFASRDHEKVSRMWYVLLHDIFYGLNGPALKNFNLNEGKRTKARQLELIREKGIYNSITNPGGAAPYSPMAPHIKEGHPDHACDFDNAAGVKAAAARRGVTLLYTVSTESWHLEPVYNELERYYNRNKARVLGIGHRDLHPGQSGEDVKYAQALLKKKGYLPRTWRVGKKYRKGRTMQKAVNKLKHDHKLPRDGDIGPRVWRILKKG